MSEQPIWRRDFPYTSEGEDEVTRREFTKYLVFASAAFAGGGGLVSLAASLRTVEKGDPMQIVALDAVEIGASYLFNYPGPNDPAILVRSDEETLLGFSQKCTHLGCVVFWVSKDDEFHCPCHDGVFNFEGRAIAGPPERPLARIDLEVRDGNIWATGRGVSEETA